MLDKILSFIAEKLARLITCLTNKVFINGQYQATAANAWQYTGLSVTVPSGHNYLVEMIPGYSTGRPIGIGLNDAQTISNAHNAPMYRVEAIRSGESIVRTPYFLLTPGTWYLFDKRESTPTTKNTFVVRGYDLF